MTTLIKSMRYKYQNLVAKRRENQKIKLMKRDIKIWSSKHPRLARIRYSELPKQAGIVTIAVVLLLQPILFNSQFIPEASALSASDTVSVDGDHSVNFATLGGSDDATCAGGTHCDRIDESALNSADYVSTGFATAYTAIDEFTVENPTISGTLTEVTGIDVTWRGQTMACRGTGGSNCDTMRVNIFIDGVAQTAQNQVLTTTSTTYTHTFTGSWSTADDLRIRFERITAGGGGGTTSHDDVRLFQAYAVVDYNYNKEKPLLSLEDYIWENTDGADAQQNSVSTGTLGSSDASNSGSGTWTNPTYANFNYSNISNDDATITLSPGGNTSWLALSGYGFDIPKSSTINGIEVRVDKFISGVGDVIDDTVQLRKNGVTLSNDKSLGTNWPSIETTFTYGSPSDLWGLSLTPEEVNSSLEFLISAAETTLSASPTVYVNFVQITVHYTPEQSTQLAAANTPITMRKGEQATLRANLRNVGGPVDIENFGLFYDRNDGLWSKVNQSGPTKTSGTDCGVSDFQCDDIETTDSAGRYPSIKYDKNGKAWIAYFNATTSGVFIAEYVGQGGTGCDNSAWKCQELIDNGADFHYGLNGIELDLDSNGNPWVTFLGNASDIFVARYLGGSTSGTGCTSNTWTCERIVSTGSTHVPSIIVSSDDSVFVTYEDRTNGDFEYAVYLNGATNGTGCDVNTWSCITIFNNQAAAVPAGLSLNKDGLPIASFTAINTALFFAEYLGGATNGTGCSVNTWNCYQLGTTVDAPSVGILDRRPLATALDPLGNPWIAYSSGSDDIVVAEYLGGATNGTGCSINTWNCGIVTSHNSNQMHLDLLFDASGNAVVAFNQSGVDISLARHLGGATNGTGCESNAWSCIVISDSVGAADFDLVHDSEGRLVMPYYKSDTTDLKISYLERSTEIMNSSNQFTATQLTESHTDMTSTTDSANRNDADCTTTATWNDGIHFDGDSLSSGLTLAEGQSSAQCTEIAWTIDTSQAIEGETYRFVIATDDAIAQSKGKWRGMVDVQNYPTITIEDSSVYDTTQWIETSANTVIDPCGSTDNWGCDYINQGSFDSGHTPTLRISSDGTIWNTWSWNNVLVASTYAGTGGSGCENLSSWNCTFIDSAGSIYYNDMALDSKGNPWIVYSTNTGLLKLATYDGDATASGCLNVAWTCRTIDTITAGAPVLNSIAINLNDQKWLTYESGIGTGSLQMARYVGSGGTGCASGVTDWTCEELDSVATSSYVSPSMTIGQDGNPWFNYMEPDGDTLYYARYVGSGGTGCTVATYTCAVLFDDGATTFTNSRPSKLTIGGPSNDINSYFATDSGSRFAQYVGSGGTGCGAGNTAWNCSVIDTSASGGADGAYDAEGNLWVSFAGTSSGIGARVAKYVGTGGTGCVGGNTVWTCTVVGTGYSVYTPDIAFDSSGSLWFIAQIVTIPRYYPIIFKHDFPMTKPTRTTVNNIYEYGKHAGKSGGHNRLTAGWASVSSNPLLCTGNNGDTGYCALQANDGQVHEVRSHGRTAPTVTSGARFPSNSVLPNITWTGRTNLPPSTTDVDGDLILQVYRHGSTNSWETIATDSSSTDCSTDLCSISGMPSGTASEYYEIDGSNYWIYFRVIQVDSYGDNITLETDSLSVYRSDQQMRGGKTFNRNLTQPLTR